MSDATQDPDDNSPATARRSGRERKPVQRLSLAGNKGILKATKSKGKGKEADGTNGEDEVSDPEEDPSDPEETSEAEDDDVNEDAEDSEDDFVKKPTPAKSKGRALSAGKASSGGKKATPAKKASAAASKKRPLKKKKGGEEGSDDDNGEGAAAPAQAFGKGDVVIEEDNTLFNAVRNPDSALQSTVDDWVESYQEATGPALAELINFFLRTCGCNASIDEHQAEDENGIVDVLDGIQDDFKNATLLAYPLISKSKALKKFRSSLANFLSRIFTTAASSEILYDETFCQTIQSWLTSLSSSKIRSFRHTATVISLFTVSSLSEVSVAVNKEFTQASRAKEAEEKKAKKDKARLKDLEKNVKGTHEKKTKVEEHLGELCDGVFANRYRDSESNIRAECIKALGHWMKVHPDYWLEGTYLKYLGWVLSDENKDVRHEAVKALISLYAKDDHIGAMQHFTERFKSQFVRMATSEVDLSVRISCIHVLRQIDTHGLLEDDQRDEIATLVFEEERRVRQAVAAFFQGVLEEKVAAQELELDVDERDRGEERGTQLTLKCLAELLVKYGRALDGFDKDDEGGEEDELEREGNELPVEEVENNRGRVAFAVEALWDQVEVLRDWQGIMGFLLLDHSEEGEGGSTPKTKAKGTRGKGKGKATASGEDALDPTCRLTEDEETLLVEVLVASLTRATGTSAASSKKEKEKEDENLAEISRIVIEALPRLFAKHQTVPSRVVDLLAIPTLISLELYLDMRLISSYEALWDDITKQLNKHANVQVIDQAVRTIQVLNEGSTLGNTNAAKMAELEETLVSSLREAVSGKDVESAAFEEDELLALGSCVLRICRLYAVHDLSNTLDDTEDGKSSAWEIIDSLVERGRLGYKDEVEVVERAINILGYHLIWRMQKLVRGPEDNAIEISEVVEQRNNFTEKLEELAVGTSANAGEIVKQAAVVLLLDIHMLCGSLTSALVDPNGRFVDLKIECGEELQARCAGFVEAEIERYGETFAEEAEEATQKDGEEDEEDDSDDDAADKRRKKKVNAKKVATREANKSKQKAAVVKTPAGIRARNAKKQARLVAAATFNRIISGFVRAIHNEVISIQHASVILIHFERFDTTLDQWCKLLVQDMRDEGIYGNEGAAIARVIVETLKGATEMLLDAPDASDERLVVISRLLSGAVVVRGAQLALVKRLRTVDHVQLHSDALAYIVKKFAVLREGKKKEASTRALSFFKALGNLLIGLDGQGALKVKVALDHLLDVNEITVLASAKAWEPVRGYQKRLTTAMSKDPTIKQAAVKKVKKVAATSGDEDENDGEDGGSQAASSPKAAKAKGRPRASRASNKQKYNEHIASDEDEDGDDEEVLPVRKRRGAHDSRDTRADGSAMGSPKKRRVASPDNASKESSPYAASVIDSPHEDEPRTDDEEEELIASQLIPSSQGKGSQGNSHKRQHSEEREEDEEVEQVEEAEEEGAGDEPSDEEDAQPEPKSQGKARPRPPTSVASQASLSDIKRKTYVPHSFI
ncbi:cohesin complex subunit SA-1/2, partial [Phenoliferia sp. Uapishka_3]